VRVTGTRRLRQQPAGFFLKINMDAEWLREFISANVKKPAHLSAPA
jgi:hypothetical protein